MTEIIRLRIPQACLRLPEITRHVMHTAMLIVSYWDPELLAHSEQVAHELLAFAPQDQEEEWYWAGLLHDIGKVGLAPQVLCKRGTLTRKERQVVQQHTLRGATILKRMNAPLTVVQGAKYHHERWDGTGYPYDIGQQQIPLVARVLAVADVYTALTSDRPYHRALTASQAREEIERNAGTQFDPEIVARFFERKSNVTR
jgi:putative nucleotidyltransferase with HDIG domain